MLELDNTKEILYATHEQIEYCELVINDICKGGYVRSQFVHDKAIRKFAKRFNINIELAEKIYNAVRYYEIQP